MGGLYHITGSTKPNAADIKKLLLSKIKELYADVSLLRPTKNPEFEMGRMASIKDISQGINRNPVQMDLIVQVRSGRSTTITNEGNGFTPLNILPLFYQGLFEMGISGDHTIAVANGYHLSISMVTIDF